MILFQTDVMEVCPSPLNLAQQLTHIELVSIALQFKNDMSRIVRKPDFS